MSKTKNNIRVLLTIGMIALVLSTVIPTRNVKAGSVITVNSTLDKVGNDDECTLREAIIAANKDKASGSKPRECKAGNGFDEVIIPAGTYTLTRTDQGKEDSSSTGDLDILASVRISGAGATATLITAISFGDRVFEIHAGDVTIGGLTISGGNVPDNGGAVSNKAKLTIQDSVITGNRSSKSAGGIFNTSTGTMVISGSTIVNNIATTDGGGISNTGSLTLLNSTVSGNQAKISGGGFANSSNARLNNVTIADNLADSDANNTGQGGGMYASSGTLSLSNTLVAHNQDGSPISKSPDCSGNLQSMGYNLVQDITDCNIIGDTTGNILARDPQITGLGNHGGLTPTYALTAGSPAINTGSPAQPGSGGNACEIIDQRGSSRPKGSRCDIGAYETDFIPSPLIIRASLAPVGMQVVVRISGQPNDTFRIDYFYSPTCDPATNQGEWTLLASSSLTTDASGNMILLDNLAQTVPPDSFFAATATSSNGTPSGFSSCIRVGQGNDSWPNALELVPAGGVASADDFIDLTGQSRWYKFDVKPGSKVVVTLSSLPANYDLTLYKDISAAFKTLTSPQDLVRLGAEFAPDAFTPDAYSPDAFTPDAFTPDAFTPDAFTPDAFTPDAFTPDAFSPDAFTPDAYTPDAFTPDAFTPDAYTPDAFTPDAYTPDAYTPDAFTPDAYSSAQTRSLIGVSSFEGTSSEGLRLNTWENSGSFYIRVRGRNGVYNPLDSFHLDINMLTGICASVNDTLPQTSLTATDGDYRTIILTDMGRLQVTDKEKLDLEGRLNVLAGRSEVRGVVVDVGADARVAAANVQANLFPACPTAKNLVASSISNIIDAYRSLNPLEYIVLVGGDDVIPFFRYPDQSLLASERNYAPPVFDDTASQASLKNGYLLTQDPYGAASELSLKSRSLPIFHEAVGRLVETPAEMMAVLDAYLSTNAGVVATPNSSLVTGYDFLEDVSVAVRNEFEAGTGAPADALIASRTLAPVESWTANDLRASLFGRRHDLIFLAGHFSTGTALAADYTTRLLATEVAQSTTSFSNSIVFSVGCHSGYNTVDLHAVPGVTQQPDWAQAFAWQGATLIAGTGYQYGDTDFIEYSERLYLNFSQELRAGTGPVPIGKALVQAKQRYLSQIPQLRGIHEKSLLEATLFGLPMLQIDLPHGRGDQQADSSIVSGAIPIGTNPGLTLGLSYADVSIQSQLTQYSVDLTDPSDQSITTAFYLSGSDGVVSTPVEPILPLEMRNVSLSGNILRGVGFLSGSYSDQDGVLPLNGSATTEIRGVHTPFLTNIFYPATPWNVNYMDALFDPAGGATQLAVIPAQYRSSTSGDIFSTLRSYSQMNFRLFYSNNTQTYANGSVPALSAPPTIVQVLSSESNGQVTFRVRVAGNPAAGIQQVWVTYTAEAGPFAGSWQPLDLIQNSQDSTIWERSMNLNGTIPSDFRFIVQAVNGVGLVSVNTNEGAYHRIGGDALGETPTLLALQSPVASGPYGTRVEFSALLTSNGQPLANQPVIFSIGPQSRLGFTDTMGRASATVSLLVLPGSYMLQAAFPGDMDYAPAKDETNFQVNRQTTTLTLPDGPVAVFPEADPLLVATLVDSTGRPLSGKTVFFRIIGSAGEQNASVITDFAGRAPLGGFLLHKGTYTVEAFFNGTFTLPGGRSVTLDDELYESSSDNVALIIKNKLPVSLPDAYNTLEDTQLQVASPGVLANDNDPDGDVLAAVQITPPSHGELILNPDGSFTYIPAPNYFGPDSFVYQAFDGEGYSGDTVVNITVDSVNDPPVCSAAYPSQLFIWPPDHIFWPETVLGVSNQEGDPVTISITAIFQDEPVNDGNTSPDGYGVGTSTAWVRSERLGNDDGRVYHIYFEASDSSGGICTGKVRVGVSDNQGQGIDPIDDGSVYDSTIAYR